MRRFLLTALSLIAAYPAAAQDAPPSPLDAEAVDDAPVAADRDDRPGPKGNLGRIADPATARAVAGAVTAMSDAVLDIRIDRLRGVVQPNSRSDPDRPRTLGDLVERDDPHFRERLHDDAERTMRTAGTAARSAAEVAPELRAIADQFRRRVEQAIAHARTAGADADR